MAASMEKSLNIDSEHLIMKLLREIENATIHQLQLCHECRQLFKPWAVLNECIKQKNIKTETIGNIFYLWPLKKDKKESTENNSTTKQDPEESLSQTDKEDIAKMEKLLNKAEKAKLIQAKFKKKEEDSENVDCDCESTLVLDKPSNPIIEDSPLNVKNCNVVEDGKQSQGEKLMNIDSTKVIHKIAGKKITQRLDDKTQPRNLQRNVSHLGVNKLLGPSFQKTEAKSSSKKPAPSFTKAPFQTNSTLTVPKRSLTQQAMVSGRKYPNARFVAQSRTDTKSADMKASKRVVSGVRSSSKSDCNQIKTVKPRNTTPENELDCMNDSSQTNKLMEEDPMVVENNCADVKDVIKLEKKLEEMNISKKKTVVETEIFKPEKSEENEEKAFYLKTDGHSVKVPLKLKRLMTVNEGLRKKLYAQMITKKLDSPHKGQNFVEKLESQFLDPRVNHYGQKVNKLLVLYKRLNSLFHSLDLPNISENSTNFEVLNAKSVVELILTLYSEAEENRLHLHSGVLHGVECLGTTETFTFEGLESSLTSGNLSLWLPGVTKFMENGKVRTIQYQSYREIERYRLLMFQIQYQKLQCQLIDHVITDFLPSMDLLNPNTSDFILVLRALYSFISDGKCVPVVVKDTIQELEDSVLDIDD